MPEQMALFCPGNTPRCDWRTLRRQARRRRKPYKSEFRNPKSKTNWEFVQKAPPLASAATGFSILLRGGINSSLSSVWQVVLDAAFYERKYSSEICGFGD